MKNVLHRIGKDIWAYVMCIFIAIMLWGWIFDLLTQIKTEEKVSVFIGSYTTGFEKTNELNQDRPEYLKVVEVNACSITDGTFKTLLNLFGYEVCDILILPESCLSKEGCAGYFAEISATYQGVFENLGYYTTDDGKAYGIKIYDKQTDEKAISSINYVAEGKEKENFYLLFNKKSVHLSDLSDEGKKSDMDGAIEIAKRLLAL